MDVRTIRLAIVSARERQGLDQRQLATKAGVDQGHMSHIENVDKYEMRDLAARIVIQLVERGLELSLSAFFGQIEGLAQPVQQTAVPSDETPSLRAEIGQLRQEVEALKKQQEHTLRRVAKANIASARRRKNTPASARQQNAGSHRGEPGARGAGKAPHRTDVRGATSIKKTP